jgi:hypothetical protein
MKSPEYHGTGRLRARFFDLGDELFINPFRVYANNKPFHIPFVGYIKGFITRIDPFRVYEKFIKENKDLLLYYFFTV